LKIAEDSNEFLKELDKMNENINNSDKKPSIIENSKDKLKNISFEGSKAVPIPMTTSLPITSQTKTAAFYKNKVTVEPSTLRSVESSTRTLHVPDQILQPTPLNTINLPNTPSDLTTKTSDIVYTSESKQESKDPQDENKDVIQPTEQPKPVEKSESK